MGRNYQEAKNGRAKKEMCVILNACVKNKENAQLHLGFLLKQYKKNMFKPNVY